MIAIPSQIRTIPKRYLNDTSTIPKRCLNDIVTIHKRHRFNAYKTIRYHYRYVTIKAISFPVTENDTKNDM